MPKGVYPRKPKKRTAFVKCTGCRKAKSRTSFYTGKRDGLLQPCKPCKRKRQRNYSTTTATPRRKNLDQHRLRRYGVTLAQVIEAQGTSKCALCLKRPAICIDHDHATGEVRGALCRTCNMILHYFEDDMLFDRITMYLQRG